MDREEIAFLKDVIKAQDKILRCYRFGDQPSEWAFAILDKFRNLYKGNTTKPVTPSDPGS